jgi:RsiW-degrading membrane proteinase PrsW (M82 family)
MEDNNIEAKGEALTPPSSSSSSGAIGGVVRSISNMGGAEGLGEFNASRFFGSVFQPHSEEEVEESLIVGTSKTTPDITAISLEYPQPWLFFRLVSASLIIFYGLVGAYRHYGNGNLIPGLIMTGSFAVPISTLFLFFELNIRRNVPLWQVFRLVFFGGVLSLILALVLYDNIGWVGSPLGASMAGLFEEPAKLAALVILMRGKRRFPYILNGLLLGAAVGCGFAVFESAGYAMRFAGTIVEGMVNTQNTDSMIDVIQMRGLLSPFAHIVWTAVAGAALWRVMRGGDFRFGLCKQKEFYIPFLGVVLCHAVWNSNFELPFMGKYVACAAVAWILALALVNLGIKQLGEEQAGQAVFKESAIPSS